MAQQLQAFPSTSVASGAFDEWLDGQPWMLIAGEDFTGSIATLRAALRNAAAKRGLKVRTRALEHEGQSALAIQAEPLPAEPAPAAKRSPRERAKS